MRRERAVTIALWVALAIYAVFLRSRLSFACGGPDTSGYMSEARLIASGRVTVPLEVMRALKLDEWWRHVFVPLGFMPAPHAAMVPTYPAGLPIHLAVLGLIGGWRHAPYYVTPLAALGCALLMFAISRRIGLSQLESAAASAALVLNPPFLWHAVQPASDVLATFWALLAIFCAVRALDEPWMAHAAGAAFAIGLWVRPTNILIGVAFVIALRFRLRLMARAAIAAAPFGVALMAWNARLYGSTTNTGYGGGVFSSLSWDGVLFAAPQHSAWLMKILTPLGFPGGLAVLFDRAAGSWTRWMLVAWFAPFFVFYSFYGFFDDWLSVRFLLPAMPALILGILLVVRDAGRCWSPSHARTSAVVAAVLTIAIAVAPFAETIRLDILPVLPMLERDYPHLIRWAEPHLPKRAVVITGVLSGAFFYYANRQIVRFDQLNDDEFQILRAYVANAGLPVFAVMPRGELDDAALRQRFHAQWTPVATEEDVTIYRLD